MLLLSRANNYFWFLVFSF